MCLQNTCFGALKHLRYLNIVYMKKQKTRPGLGLPKRFIIARLDWPKAFLQTKKEETTTGTVTTSGTTC